MAKNSGIKWDAVSEVQTQSTVETIGSKVQIILRDPKTKQEWVTSSVDYINALVTLGLIPTGGGYWDVSSNNIFNNNSGNVGIGTTTPAYRLDVTDDSQVFAPYLQIGIDDGDPYCFIGNREGGDNLSFAEFTVSDFNFVSKALTDVMSVQGRPQYISFSNAGGEILYIDGATNSIGIGTAAPTSLLTVEDGDIEITNKNNGLIVYSQDGTAWRVGVSDLGVVTATAV